MRARDSLCKSTPFDGTCQLSMFQHRHCSVCRVVLLAVGGGGDDGRGVGGYEDEHGNSAVVCAGCDDDFFLLCAACASQDSRCDACRAERSA